MIKCRFLFEDREALTPSLSWCHRRTTNKCAKFEIVKPLSFLFRVSKWTDFDQNAQHWKQICYRAENILLCRRAHAHFSPEIWLDVAVMRLTCHHTASCQLTAASQQPPPSTSSSAGYNTEQMVTQNHRVQERCESRGGRPGLPVLMSLTVSVDVKSQFVSNMSTRHPRTLSSTSSPKVLFLQTWCSLVHSWRLWIDRGVYTTCPAFQLHNVTTEQLQVMTSNKRPFLASQMFAPMECENQIAARLILYHAVSNIRVCLE